MEIWHKRPEWICFGEGYSAQGSRIYKIRGNTYSYFYSTIVKETPNDINQLLISYHHLMNYLELLKTYMMWTNLNFNQVTSSHCQPKQLVRQMLSQIMVKSVKSVKKNYASTTLYSAICGKVAGKVILQKPCLNLSSAFHVREPSWPTNMKLWRVKPSKSPAVPVPHRFLSSFFDIVNEWQRDSQLRGLRSLFATQEENIGIVIHQLFRRIASQKGCLSWLDLGVIHCIPTQVSAWCGLRPPSHRIVVSAWCILASMYDGVIELVLIVTNP